MYSNYQFPTGLKCDFSHVSYCLRQREVCPYHYSDNLSMCHRVTFKVTRSAERGTHIVYRACLLRGIERQQCYQIW